MQRKKKKESTSRNVFQIFNYTFLLLFTFICIYPFWYIIIYSFSTTAQVAINPPLFLPSGFTLQNYLDIFLLQGFFSALLMSVLRTLVGTTLTILACSFLGYLFTKEEMPFRKVLYRGLIVTMYVNGGLIATFITIQTYGLLNNFLVYILPTLV